MADNKEIFDRREFCKSYAIAYLEAAINELAFHNDPTAAAYKLREAAVMLKQVAQAEEIVCTVAG